MLLLAVLVTVDPIVSLNVTAHLDPQCPRGCRVVSASLRHVTGETAVAASAGGDCTETLLLEHLPFGARLTPRVAYTCDGVTRAEEGGPVTVAPYLTNVAIDQGTVWVPALAEPRGAERIRLRVWGEGLDVSADFATRELVLRGLTLPPDRVQVRATLEPYGVASNTRTVRFEQPPTKYTAESTGCASTACPLFALFFLRRRFPSVRPFC